LARLAPGRPHRRPRGCERRRPRQARTDPRHRPEVRGLVPDQRAADDVPERLHRPAVRRRPWRGHVEVVPRRGDGQGHVAARRSRCRLGRRARDAEAAGPAGRRPGDRRCPGRLWPGRRWPDGRGSEGGVAVTAWPDAAGDSPMTEPAFPGLEGMVALTERLTQLLADQARAFEQHRPQDAAADLPEVTRLTGEYRAGSAQVRANPQLLHTAAPQLRARLLRATEAFEAVLQRQGRALAAS